MKLRIEPEENTLDHEMDYHLMDENGESVCVAIQSAEQARHIVHCVNNHERLVEALRNCIDDAADIGYESVYNEEARELLAPPWKPRKGVSCE